MKNNGVVKGTDNTQRKPTAVCPICKREYELDFCPDCRVREVLEQESDPNCTMCHGTGWWRYCPNDHDGWDMDRYQNSKISYYAWLIRGKVKMTWWVVTHPVKHCKCHKRIVRILWWHLGDCDDCSLPF